MELTLENKTFPTIARYTIPFLIIILWQFIYLLLGEPAMASPWQSFLSLKENSLNWLSDIWITLITLFISFIIAAVSGTIIGFLIGLSPFWSEVLNPIIISIYSIPKITLYPVFLLIFGLTVEGRIAFSVFHAIFPIIILSIGAIRTIPEVYFKVANIYKLSFLQKARLIIIPAIRPQLVVGYRMGFNLAFLGLILAEMFASFEGLGSRLVHYMSLNRPESILAIICIIIFIALFITFLFLLWQERIESKIGKIKNI
mgnify:FL=1